MERKREGGRCVFRALLNAPLPKTQTWPVVFSAFPKCTGAGQRGQDFINFLHDRHKTNAVTRLALLLQPVTQFLRQVAVDGGGMCTALLHWETMCLQVKFAAEKCDFACRGEGDACLQTRREALGVWLRYYAEGGKAPNQRRCSVEDPAFLQTEHYIAFLLDPRNVQLARRHARDAAPQAWPVANANVLFTQAKTKMVPFLKSFFSKNPVAFHAACQEWTDYSARTGGFAGVKYQFARPLTLLQWWHDAPASWLSHAAVHVHSMQCTNQAAEHGWAHLARALPPIRNRLRSQTKSMIAMVQHNAVRLYPYEAGAFLQSQRTEQTCGSADSVQGLGVSGFWTFVSGGCISDAEGSELRPGAKVES